MAKDFYHQIRKQYPSLSATDRHIADYVQQNANDMLHKRVSDVAADLNVASSTIINFCKQIGYSGYTELKMSIAQNLTSHLERIMDDVKMDDELDSIIAKTFRANIRALQDTQKHLDHHEINAALEEIRSARKILAFGIGPSGLVAQDIYSRFLRIGLPVQYVVDPLIMLIEAQNLDNQCAAIAVSYSGRTEATVHAAQNAKKAGAKVICLTGYDSTALVNLSDIRLIAYTQDTKLFRESSASRLAQMTIIDALYAGLALADYDRSRIKLEELEEAYQAIRVDG